MSFLQKKTEIVGTESLAGEIGKGLKIKNCSVVVLAHM